MLEVTTSDERWRTMQLQLQRSQESVTLQEHSMLDMTTIDERRSNTTSMLVMTTIDERWSNTTSSPRKIESPRLNHSEGTLDVRSEEKR